MQSLPRELFAIRAIPNSFLKVTITICERYQLDSAALSYLRSLDTRPITNDPIQDTQVDYERSLKSIAKKLT